jgi:hypothetical protein
VEPAGTLASANHRQDHFGWAVCHLDRKRQFAHSACFGLGLERLAVALFYAHGVEETDGLLRSGDGSGPETVFLLGRRRGVRVKFAIGARRLAT